MSFSDVACIFRGSEGGGGGAKATKTILLNLEVVLFKFSFYKLEIKPQTINFLKRLMIPLMLDHQKLCVLYNLFQKIFLTITLASFVKANTYK